YKLDIIIDRGANARSIQIQLPHFTLIGATTRAGLLTSPLRSRFGVVNRLDFYAPEQLYRIIMRSAKILEVEIEEQAGMEIAKRSRGTPRVSNRLLRRIRDFAQIEGDGVITAEIAHQSLLRLDVDEMGLDEMDKRILKVMIEKFNGGPVGINTLAVAIGEQGETLEEIYEPYLIQEGLMKRTPRGRVATELAYRHFGKIKPNVTQQNLF
ncbi:MAG: Holliday junction branch migration DNA helicase RuvB, partial [Calditrichaeota bacterium]